MWSLHSPLNLLFKESLLGHINHTLFWKNLAPTTAGGGQFPDGPLKSTIIKDFGSLEGLGTLVLHLRCVRSHFFSFQGKDEHKDGCYSRFWLGMARLQPWNLQVGNRHNRKPGSPHLYALSSTLAWILLKISSLAHTPIIGIDIWEHVCLLVLYCCSRNPSIMFLILRPSTFNTRMSSQTCVVFSLQFTYAAHTLRVVSTSRQSGTSSTSRKQKSVSSRLRNDYNQTLTHQLNEQIVNPKFLY